MVRTHGDDEDEQRVIDDIQRVGWHIAHRSPGSGLPIDEDERASDDVILS